MNEAFVPLYIYEHSVALACDTSEDSELPAYSCISNLISRFLFQLNLPGLSKRKNYDSYLPPP